MENKQERTEIISKKIQLAILCVSIIAAGSKAYYDISLNRQKIEIEEKNRIHQVEEIKKLHEAQISELKRKIEEDNKKMSEIKTDVAVMKVQMNSIDRQASSLIEKTEKIYDILRERK